MHLVWKVLRPYYWMLDRRVRNSNRVMVIVVVLLVLWVGQWVFNLLRENAALLESGQVAALVASYLPLMFFLLLVFGLLGMGDMIHQLFLAPEMELLLAAPIPTQTIFLVKLLQGSRALLIPALGVGLSLAAAGLASGAATGYYLLVILWVLSAVMFTTAVLLGLALLLGRLLPAQKIRSWMPGVIFLLTSLLLLSQQPLTNWLLGQRAVMAFFTGTLVDLGLFGLFTIGTGLAAILASLGGYRLFVFAFQEGWNRFQEVPSPAADTARQHHRQRWAALLPSPLRFFLSKEWLELRRNPRGLINLMQPLALVMVVFMLFSGAGRGSEILRPLLFWFMLFFLAMFLCFVPLGTGLMVVAQEGRNIALLRSMPVRMAAVLRGKFWTAWVPFATAWALVLLAAGSWMGLPFWQIGALIVLSVWNLAGGTMVAVAVGGWMVDFSVEDLKGRITLLANYLSMGLNVLFVLLNVVSLIWISVHVFPQNTAVQAIQTLSGFRVLAWVFSGNLWVPLGLAGGQVLFALLAAVLWRTAVRRLEEWQEDGGGLQRTYLW
jgi:hypothetical protein